ncbi:site-specific integrase [Acinetobacter bohemicus]|uniref:Phage integrase family protein n=1 Tax=Acinetobacter bohemicus TaxID=1435036 RepID=A0A1I6VPN4_9GAMM|nr:site-specific integrase [Acinetobacter bohemicus]KAB0651114.1 site-specific integrase [Acinetobacter bohemicus]SFT15700.1 Phage integrase family protein [Acinetobacter bohemicus]
MASLEFINYQPRSIQVKNNSISWKELKTKRIDRLPQIVWADNSTWAEANLWALEQATSSKCNIKTVRSNMSHLLAYAKWLESESIDWWHFPERESERCLVRFRGALIQARNLGELAPSTTSQRMSSVIRYYKWVREKGLISPDWPMWQDRFVGIKITNAFGLEHTLRVVSTDLAIPNRKVAGSIDLEDGLLPVSALGMKEILTLADERASEEFALMLRIGFFTGLRLGSITDLKVSTLQNATIIPNVGLKMLSVGPGARPPVATKFDVSGSVPIPTELVDTLLDYAMSTRRLKRQALASHKDQDILFLTRYGNTYSGDNSRAVNVEMSRFRTLGKDLGINVLRGFHFHRTRATYATELMKLALKLMSVSESIQFVREACLHKDEMTTMKYVRFIENNRVMKEVSDAFTLAFMGLIVSRKNG